MQQDILVIGGGPAGISTALHLAALAPHLTPRILVLEKAHYPRHKLCGGGLTQDAEIILESLGLDISELPHVDAGLARFDFAGRGMAMRQRRGRTLRLIRRDEFDAWLAAKARQAGIVIREGVEVRRIRPGPSDVLIETTMGSLEGAIVVGADGSNGVTRRCVLPTAPIHTARALEVLVPELPGPSGRPSGKSAHRGDTAYFDFSPVPHGIAGYTWDFPTQRDGVPMRCWGIYDTNLLAGHSRPPLRQQLADAARHASISIDGAQLEGHPIRWFNPRSELSVPRVLLVGDAAGADGIFGEGISMALGYGTVAARAIVAAITKGDFSFRDYRRRVLRSPMGRALTSRSAIAYFVYRLHWAWFQKLLWRVLKPIIACVSYVLVLNWSASLVGSMRRSAGKKDTASISAK